MLRSLVGSEMCIRDSMPSFILIHPTVWPQYTNVTDRTGKTGRQPDCIGQTVLQAVAQKPRHASSSSDYTVYLFLEQCLIIPRLSPYKTEANIYYADDHKSSERELTHRNCLHCGSRSRGALTFSKLGGVQCLGVRYCVEQNTDGIPSFVHCRLLRNGNHTLHKKVEVVRPNFF